MLPSACGGSTGRHSDLNTGNASLLLLLHLFRDVATLMDIPYISRLSQSPYTCPPPPPPPSNPPHPSLCMCKNKCFFCFLKFRNQECPRCDFFSYGLFYVLSIDKAIFMFFLNFFSGAIQVLRNAVGVGGCKIFREKALPTCTVRCH